MISEVALRFYEKFLIPSYKNPDFFYYVPDKDTGLWMADPDKIRPYINSFGMFDKERNIDKKEGVFRIAIIGDSFINGIHVGLSNRVNDLIEKQGGGILEVLNFGISSVGTVQELFIYRNKVKKFKPDLVILGFFIGNDVQNNFLPLELATGYRFLKKGFPYCEKRPDGSFYYTPAQFKNNLTNKLSYNLRKYCYTYKYVRTRLLPPLAAHFKRVPKIFDEDSIFTTWPPRYLTYGVYIPPTEQAWKDAWDITEHVLLEFKKEVEEDKAEFLVVLLTDYVQILPEPKKVLEKIHGIILPENFSVDYPNMRLERFCKEQKIDCINLLPIFRKYTYEHNLKEPYFSFNNDGHWNCLGHKTAGDILYNYILKNYIRIDSK